MLASKGFAPLEFHAPPPSPEGPESPDDGEVEGFLGRRDSLPKLDLPDRVFPRQIHSADPPEIDFQSLGAPASLENLRTAARMIGCFQLVNHGIPREVISAAEGAAAEVFRLGPEKKPGLAMSPAKRSGFEECGEEVLFWWCHGGDCESGGGEASGMEMAGIWPEGYLDFSCKMGRLQREIGKIAGKIGQVLFSHAELAVFQDTKFVRRTSDELIESVLHINKYVRGQERPALEYGLPNALQHDAVRLLIRSCQHPHALCIHVTSCSRFQVFSKRGWISFQPNSEAFVVTIGNQVPAWKDTLYKHVMGKPVFGTKDKDSISVAVLFSCPTMEKVCTAMCDDKKAISLAQQALLAAFIILLYHIIVYICGKV